MTLAERAAEIAKRASTRVIEEKAHGGWWLVRKHSDAEPVEVFFHPAQTAREVRALYPGCGVTPK